jgi:hypothetical protein
MVMIQKGWVMVFNATFDNISVVSWWLALLVDRPEYTKKIIDQLQNFIT